MHRSLKLLFFTVLLQALGQSLQFYNKQRFVIVVEHHKKTQRPERPTTGTQKVITNGGSRYLAGSSCLHFGASRRRSCKCSPSILNQSRISSSSDRNPSSRTTADSSCVRCLSHFAPFASPQSLVAFPGQGGLITFIVSSITFLLPTLAPTCEFPRHPQLHLTV